MVKIMRIVMASAFLLIFAAAARAGAADEAAKIEGYVHAYLDLVTERSAKSTDMGRVGKLYGSLAPLLQEADRVVPGLKAEADAYLAKAETAAGKSSLQGVEKTVQMAFVVLLRSNLEIMESRRDKPAEALAGLDLARAYYGGLENTFKRRGGELGSVNVLHDQMVYAFGYLEKEVKAKHRTNIAKGWQAVDDLLVRVYLLSVLYELDGIAANRGKDENVVAEKQIEGQVFFRILRLIDPKMKSAAPIEAELAKPPAEIDIRLLKERLAAAYPKLAGEYRGKF